MEGLSIENTLWMNTVVATGTVLGLVIYTGPDTRSVMNASMPETKVGILDMELNSLSKVRLSLLLYLLDFQFILS
jgi:phospholipid-translocating ATPase